MSVGASGAKSAPVVHVKQTYGGNPGTFMIVVCSGRHTIARVLFDVLPHGVISKPSDHSGVPH